MVSEGAVVWIEKARVLALVMLSEGGRLVARDRLGDVHQPKREEAVVILTAAQADRIGRVLWGRGLRACPPAGEGVEDPRDAEERNPEIACAGYDCRSMCPHRVCIGFGEI